MCQAIYESMYRTPSLPMEIVKAISDAKGVDPIEIEYPLGEFINIEAVELLANQSRVPWTVAFELPDHTVTVRSDGAILVDDTKENTWL